MILYQYRCNECGIEFGAWNEREERNIIILCPFCASVSATRIFYPPYIRFKGDGWTKATRKPAHEE